MMQPSVIALFCEDIREEKGDILTLIGLLPDNVSYEKGPDEAIKTVGKGVVKFLAKLHIYVRVNFDPEDKSESGEVRLITPEGTVLSLGAIDSEVVARSKSQALEKHTPVSGVITRAAIVLLSKKPLGRFTVEVTFGDKTYIGGSINFFEQ